MTHTDPLAKLTLSTQRRRETEEAHSAARQDVITDLIAALKAGTLPTDVVERSPFTAASSVRSPARTESTPSPKLGI